MNQKWPQDTAGILHVSSPRPGSLMSFSCHLFRRRGNRCSIVLGARKSFLKDWHKQSPKRSPNLTKNKSLLRKKIDTKAIGEMEDWPGKIRPHRRCWGVIFRMALVKGYRFPGGGAFFGQNLPVFDRSWRSPSKNTVKNSTEDTCSWTRPSKIGKRKVKKPRVFQLFDLNFLVCNIFFCGSAGGRARRRILSFWTRFRTDFRRFVIAETLVFTVFSVFCMLDG